jgi:predicted dehydrogenase
MSLKVAVVGAGYWGPNLVRNFSSTPGMEVAWVCDLSEARLADIARKFRVGRTTTRFDELLQDPTLDAIALATPVASHRPLGEQILKAGKHLWVEKPLAGTVADAQALVSLAAQTKRCLFVDHTFLYTPAVRKIRELISTGEIGDVLYFDSVRVNLGLFQSDTNVLWDLGPHDLSIASYTLGVNPTSVSTVGIRHVEGAHEDMAYATLRYDKNLMAHFHFNWLAPVKVRFTMIGGSKKMIVYDDLEVVEKIKIYDKGIDVAQVDQDLEARRRALISYRSNGQMGLEVVRVLAGAQKSLEQGGTSIKL